jgi:hypothetical protein
MLKFITLAVCVIGFVFLGPKALAEFRHAHPRTRIPPSDSPQGKDNPTPGIAA